MHKLRGKKIIRNIWIGKEIKEIEDIFSMVSQIKEGWENLWKGNKIKEENMEG